ncbi:BMP family ABC transporter substrate-binding protein [Spirochaetia bacterium]|nr:BMP family ABC transporter substrate-binding protein [Spirochaetia bacterium]
MKRNQPRTTREGLCGLWLILIFLALGLAACSKPEEKAWRPGMPLAREQVKIGVLYPNRDHGSSGWDYSHYSGIEAMRRELGLREDQIVHHFNVSEGDPEVMKSMVRDCIRDGAKIIIATSWDFMEPCEELAAEFPGVVFANATGTKYNQTNFTNYYARFYDARYLSGIVAGLKTQTGKVGLVAAMGKDNNEVCCGINAFALGVEKVNPGAQVYVRVTYNWFDPMGETVAANSLIADGCDVIAQDTDSSAPILAAQGAGVWGIGYNTDMSLEAPEAVITSVIYHWEVYYTLLVRSVIDGTFTTAPYLGSLTDGMVDITDIAAELATLGMAEKIAAERQRIISGAFNVFDGVMETNDGLFIGKEGKTLEDSEIFGNMHWYYRNVVESGQ